MKDTGKQTLTSASSPLREPAPYLLLVSPRARRSPSTPLTSKMVVTRELATNPDKPWYMRWTGVIDQSTTVAVDGTSSFKLYHHGVPLPLVRERQQSSISQIFTLQN